MEIAVLQDFANQALTWIGFGTVIGLITLAALRPRSWRQHGGGFNDDCRCADRLRTAQVILSR